MTEKPASIKLDLKNLSYEDGASLYDFIKQQEGVEKVHVRLAGMSASAEAIRAKNPVQFTGFEIFVGSTVGKRLIDSAIDWVKEWANKRKLDNPDIEITIYGPDDKPLKKVKRHAKKRRRRD